MPISDKNICVNSDMKSEPLSHKTSWQEPKRLSTMVNTQKRFGHYYKAVCSLSRIGLMGANYEGLEQSEQIYFMSLLLTHSLRQVIPSSDINGHLTERFRD